MPTSYPFGLILLRRSHEVRLLTTQRSSLGRVEEDFSPVKKGEHLSMQKDLNTPDDVAYMPSRAGACRRPQPPHRSLMYSALGLVHAGSS